MMTILVSCSNAGNRGNTAGAVEKTDSCRLDPQHTYEVFVPARSKDAEKLPLLVILDAHGGGKSSLERFKLAAGHYTAVLVASNLVKNGLPGYDLAIKTLIGDARQKYPVSETIFITGFSGGARMALGYALKNKTDGLILCGALAGADQINALQCPVISISGMDDFNFMETAQYLFQQQAIPQNLKIELTHASHDWPDSLTLANTFGFLYLSSGKKNIPSSSKSQIKSYCTQQHTRIDSLEKAGDFLLALQVARNLSSTEPFNRDKSFISSYNNLKANSRYIDQMNRLEKCLRTETNARQPYLEAFTAKDSLWWKNEIGTIENKIKTEMDPFTADMYRRIKSFWGIACYSLGNQAVTEHNPENLEKVLVVYRLIEPDNSYIPYLSAFLYFWKGDNAATITWLKKALDAGFTDIALIKNNFPEMITKKLDD